MPDFRDTMIMVFPPRRSDGVRMRHERSPLVVRWGSSQRMCWSAQACWAIRTASDSEIGLTLQL